MGDRRANRGSAQSAWSRCKESGVRHRETGRRCRVASPCLALVAQSRSGHGFSGFQQCGERESGIAVVSVVQRGPCLAGTVPSLEIAVRASFPVDDRHPLGCAAARDIAHPAVHIGVARRVKPSQPPYFDKGRGNHCRDDVRAAERPKPSEHVRRQRHMQFSECFVISGRDGPYQPEQVGAVSSPARYQLTFRRLEREPRDSQVAPMALWANAPRNSTCRCRQERHGDVLGAADPFQCG